MFANIGENTLHIFAAVNFLSIPIVWAFYPETANRTLEEMDHLFRSDSIFVWNEEAAFKRYKEEEDQAKLQVLQDGKHSLLEPSSIDVAA